MRVRNRRLDDLVQSRRAEKNAYSFGQRMRRDRELLKRGELTEDQKADLALESGEAKRSGHRCRPPFCIVCRVMMPVPMTIQEIAERDSGVHTGSVLTFWT
jgi:hypothetical protein